MTTETGPLEHSQEGQVRPSYFLPEPQPGHPHPSDWYTIFDTSTYHDQYTTELSVERTAKEADFIARAAQLTPTDSMLDLGSGHGRHTIELAKRGFHVTGLDIAEKTLQRAESDANKAGINVNFVRGDMRDLETIFQPNTFDVVYNVFTTFGYFSEEENQRVLEGVASALKPSGRFLLDVLSGESVQRKYAESGIKEDNGWLVMHTTQVMSGKEREVNNWFDPVSQMSHTQRVWQNPNGTKEEYNSYMRTYTLPQLKGKLEAAGFAIETVHGDYDGNPHDTNGNTRTIILARKSA